MSEVRSFELSGGRLGTRSVGLYLMYLRCMARLVEVSLVYVW